MSNYQLDLSADQLSKLRSARKPKMVQLTNAQLTGEQAVKLTPSQLAKVRSCLRTGAGCRLMLSRQSVTGHGVRGVGVRGLGAGPSAEVKRLVRQILKSGVSATVLSKKVVQELKGGAVERVDEIIPGAKSVPYLGQALAITAKIQDVVDKIPVPQRSQDALEARLKLMGVGVSSITQVGKEMGIPAGVMSGRGVRGLGLSGGNDTVRFLEDFWAGFKMGFTQPIRTVKWLGKEVEHAISQGKGVAGGCCQCGGAVSMPTKKKPQNDLDLVGLEGSGIAFA